MDLEELQPHGVAPFGVGEVQEASSLLVHPLRVKASKLGLQTQSPESDIKG